MSNLRANILKTIVAVVLILGLLAVSIGGFVPKIGSHEIALNPGNYAISGNQSNLPNNKTVGKIKKRSRFDALAGRIDPNTLPPGMKTSKILVYRDHSQVTRSESYMVGRKYVMKSVELRDVYFERAGNTNDGSFFIVSQEAPQRSLSYDFGTANGAHSVKITVERKSELDKTPSSYREVHLGIMSMMGNCVMNYHHAWVDTFMPLIHTTYYSQNYSLTPYPMFVNVPLGPHMWGMNNRACPLLNNHPYGFQHILSWMFQRIMQGSAYNQFKPVVSVLETQRGYKRQKDRDSRTLRFHFKRLIVGFNFSCHDDVLHVANEFPFYTTTERECSDIWLKARAELIKLSGQSEAGGETEKVPPSEWLCPHVTILSRQGRRNGRVVDNMNTLIDKLRARVPSCGTVQVVAMETLRIPDQIALMRRTTVFIAPRGAGSINYLFLRSGAAFLSMSAINFNHMASRYWDNMPWHPTAAIPTHIVTHFMLCAVTTCMNKKVVGNLCNMECNEAKFFHEYDLMLMRAQGKAPLGLGKEDLHLPPYEAREDAYYYLDRPTPLT